MLAVTNHYTAPSLRTVQGRRPLDASCRRMATLEMVSGEDAWWDTVAILSDHDAAICCHREFGTTLWAGLFDLTARRVAYCFGAPCRNPFRVFAFPGGAT
jgi:hypothetical protein